MSRLLLSRASSIATPASTSPMRMDATPSIIGMRNVVAANVPSVANIIPSSAALSSKSTMNDGGSLLRTNASYSSFLPLAARNCLNDTIHDAPSNTNASASTM